MRTDRIPTVAEGELCLPPLQQHIFLSPPNAASHFPLLPTPLGIAAAFVSPQGCLDNL